MVEAKITDYGFVITGHADYAKHGYDIVCAGISALSQSIAIALKKHCKAKAQFTNGLGIVVDIERPTDESTMLLDVLRIGLLHIERDYPEHLQVRIKRGVFK